MNILFTAGTQFSFPRLSRVVSVVANARPTWQLNYQAGPAADIELLETLPNVDVQELYVAEDFQFKFSIADLVVTHAGMGNIMACLEQEKSFFMLPRLSSRSEHRNDHQIDTAEAIVKRYQVACFHNTDSLIDAIFDFDNLIEPSFNFSAQLEYERQSFNRQLNRLLMEMSSL